MAVQPTSVSLAQFRSWFNDTRYAVRAELDNMMNDPIFDLLGEDTSDNTSDTLSTTGIDYSGYAKAKVPGGTVTKDAPVQADQHSVYYVTFVHRFNYELESILHDQYKVLDPDGTEAVKRLWNSVGLFLTNCLWNQNQNSSFNIVAHEGTISYTITTPDGQPIISASHSGPGYSGKTNIGGTGPLSGPNLVTNIQVGNQNLTTAGGFSQPYDADAILIGNVEPMVETAKQITQSQKVSSTANNAVNIYSGGSKDVIVFKHAPKTAAGAYDTTTTSLYKWATANKRNMKRFMRYKWIARPQMIGEKNLDDSNLDSFRTAFCRIAFLPENPFCLFQNNASTAPTTAW